MGDFFARNLGLGHVQGLPILALLFAILVFVEQRDKFTHEVYYWFGIIVVRTAATNLADFAAGDLKLNRGWVMLALAVLLVVTVSVSRSLSKRRTQSSVSTGLPPTDSNFWVSMLVAGTLGTVAGDFSSFGSGLGLVNASIILCVVLGAWFYFGGRLLQIIPFYWFTVVLVRTAGTAVGDFLAGRTVGLGLPLCTLLTGLLFIVTLILWKPKQTVTLGESTL